MSSEIFLKHTGKTYLFNIEFMGNDYLLCNFNSGDCQQEFFNSFHVMGDVNIIDDVYYLRYEPESYCYEILVKSEEEHFILEVMYIGIDSSTYCDGKCNSSCVIEFLNGDVRTKEMYKSRMREIKLSKILPES